MKNLKILTYPDFFLKRVAKPVRKLDINDNLHNVVNLMFSVMREVHGLGLAATQVGLDMRIFIMDKFADSKPIIAINPEIIEKKGNTFDNEGCLSLPGVYAKIKRYDLIKLNALDISGNFYEITKSGYVSRCIQHEIDHLNGIMYFEHLSSLKRSFLIKKYNKINRLKNF